MLTDFYQSSSVSSASRAGLLTGRLNIHNGVPNVYYPNEGGLPSSEITIAEELRELGYATACIGKWHLGDAPEQMPLNQGFDEFFGIPYSNDMHISPLIEISESVNFRDDYTLEMAQAEQKIAARGFGVAFSKGLRYKVPLVENSEIVEYPCDQSTLTRRYIDRTIEFVQRNATEGRPFFAYVTPAMPHVPLFASEQFLGKSERGLYGDCVEEIDWNVGRLLDMLDEAGLSENTIVIFTSDNGPCPRQGENGGCAEPLRDGKFSCYEGGVRVPYIMRWPGVVPAGAVSGAVVRSVDLLPTFVKYAGGDAPDHPIDGKDVSHFFKNPKKSKGLDEYVYIRKGIVRGVRKGDWVYLPYAGNGGFSVDKNKPELFDLSVDLSERKNVISANPQKLAELKALYDSYVADSELSKAEQPSN